MAQAELGQAGAYNSFQQANYATMNGIAFNAAADERPTAASNCRLSTRAAGTTSAIVGGAGAAASKPPEQPPRSAP